MKLCKDCKYFKSIGSGCYSPDNGVSLLDGEPKYRNAFINRNSSISMLYNSTCGPDALYFKEKPIAWYKFWR